MDALWFEAGLLGKPAEDQEGAGPGQGAALCVQEELGAVAAVEMRTTTGQIATQRIRRRPPERDDPFLGPLADRAHDSLVEIDVGLRETDRFADAKPGAVEQFDEGAVP